MLAPRRLPTRYARTLVVVLVVVGAMLAASGCTMPGAGRITGSPEGMPTSMRYLPGNALGWVIADTDPDRAERRQLETVLTGARLPDTRLVRDLVGDRADATGWIGRSAGRAWLTSSRGIVTEIGFADVRDRAALEEQLEQHGWRATQHELATNDDHVLRLWSRAAGAGYRAVGVADDALVATQSPATLRVAARAARDYAASDRVGQVEYTIAALRATPVALVYRSDVLANDARIRVSGSPAADELSRWVLRSGAVYAMRDGWIGLSPARGARARTDVRFIGRMDRAAVATSIPEPTHVPRRVLAAVPADARAALALADPGAYLADLVETITARGGQFATELDAAPGTPQLGPLLDDLDGPAVVSLLDDAAELSITTTDARSMATRVRAALQLAGASRIASVEAPASDRIVVRVALGDVARRWVEALAGERAVGASRDLRRAVMDATRAVGTPARRPVAWIYRATSPCDAGQPLVGWITYEAEQQRLSTTIDVPVRQDRPARDGCLPPFV